MDQQNSAPAGLPKLFDLAKETFFFYSRAWKTMLKISSATLLSFLAPSILTSLIFSFAWIAAGKPSDKDIIRYGISALSDNHLFAIPFLLIFVFFYIFFPFWMSIATIVALRDSHDNVGFFESMKRARPYMARLSPYLLAGIIVSIASMGIVIFMLPGIIILTWLLFAAHIIIVEDEKGTAAPLKCNAYLKGFFWKTFSLIFFGLITSLAVLMLTTIVPPVFLAALIVVFHLMTIFTYLIFDYLRAIKKDRAFHFTKRTKLIFAGFAFSLLAIILFAFGSLIYYGPAINEYIKNNPEKFKNLQNRNTVSPIKLNEIFDKK